MSDDIPPPTPPCVMLEFKPRKKSLNVIECGAEGCGRQDFWINEDGTLECRGCGLLQFKRKWIDITK